MRRALVLVVVACSSERVSTPAPRTVEERLRAAVGCAHEACAAEVARWKLDRAAWDRTVVDPYRGAAVYEGYARAFDAAAPALAAQLARGGSLAVRPHYADDPALTVGQQRARWALPVQYPSKVAELDGAALDAVFLTTPSGLGAIVGVDQVLHARATALDPACAALLARARIKPCVTVAWVIAEAALREDRERFTRACALAGGQCPP